MDTATIIVDLLGVLAIIAGGLMLFAQKLVRSGWSALARKPIDPDRGRTEAGEDPVHYALTIFGVMLLAFGLILFGFFTAFALFSA